MKYAELTTELVPMSKEHWAMVDWDVAPKPSVTLWFDLPGDPADSDGFRVAHYVCQRLGGDVDQWILEALEAFKHAKVFSFDVRALVHVKGAWPSETMEMRFDNETWVWSCRIGLN